MRRMDYKDSNSEDAVSIANKCSVRDKINDDVERFLADGGKVTIIEPGETAANDENRGYNGKTIAKIKKDSAEKYRGKKIVNAFG